MAVDGLTVAAQVANFLILVWLLKRFLYQRVIDAMDRRQQQIEVLRQQAQADSDEARQEVQRFRRKNQELEEQRESKLAVASAEADTLRQERLDALRVEIEATRRTWLQQVEREREAFLGGLRDQAATRFLALARRSLADLANADLEAQMVATFLARLHGEPGGDARGALAAIAARCRAAGEPVIVSSGFDLAPELKRRITHTLHGDVGDDLAITYQISSDISCGLELSGGGRSVLWSLDGYLDGLEARLSALLEENGVAVGRSDGEIGASHA
jgi:F-type H+-transporting ATPase subunit b